MKIQAIQRGYKLEKGNKILWSYFLSKIPNNEGPQAKMPHWQIPFHCFGPLSENE